MVEAIVGEMIPILAIVLGMSVAIIGVISKHRRGVQELEHRHKERMAAIDKGLDLPLEPIATRFSADKPMRSSERRYLLRGLVWLGIGLAIAFQDLGVTHDVRLFGWIAVAIGAAYLIYYFAEGRRAAPPANGGLPPGDGTKS